MKICILSRSIPEHSIGGMEIHCWIVACVFAKREHKVKLITTSHPKGIEYKKIDKNLEVFYLKGTKPGKYSKTWWERSLQKFFELNSVEKFDVVLSESSGALSVLKYKVKNQLNIPIILVMHGTAIRDAISQLKQLSIRSTLAAVKNYIFSLRDIRWIKYSDAVIACSDEVAKSLIEQLKVPKEKVYTILNGVDTEKFSPYIDTLTLRKQLNISEEYKVITCITRLKLEKGVHILLKAFKEVIQQRQNVFLMIVGSGNYQEKLKDISKELNIEEKVKFIGSISHENLAGYYAVGDIFVFPTLAKEGLPWVVLEAMSCGRPVIASRIGGIPQIIKDSENGLLFEPGNINELKEKIFLLLENYEICKKLSKNARDYVVQNLSQEKMIDETLRVISKCLIKM